MLDAVVIGGGFYGAAIAIYLKNQRKFSSVVLVEQGQELLQRASYNNQARIHNGYHYPRSFTTAYRSRVNVPHFVRDYPQAVKKDFTKLYAVAKRNSKVTARQFQRFCHEIGAKIEPASDNMRSLFDKRLIEDVFLVEEYAFDTDKLAQWARTELNECGVKVRLDTRVVSINKLQNGLSVQCNDEAEFTLDARYIFNCTYSGLNQIGGDFYGTKIKLKHEISEMALMKVPSALIDVGVTVMDGPFFSLMPFPSKGMHTLSHVRYTPHFSWADKAGVDPYQRLENYSCETRVDRMIRDVERYMPMIAETEYIKSLFEIKTVLVKNEADDGRPILFEKHMELSGLYSILGGKIDNIYDVLEKLDAEYFKLND